jgi:hypothetical protein
VNRNHLAALCGAAALVVAVAVTAVGVAGSAEVAGHPVASAADPFEAATGTATTTTTAEPDPLDLDDFVPTLRVTDKQCFGSAGCNVTVEADLEYVHDLATLEDRTYSITLSITGDESGPVITTIDGTGDSYDLMPVLLSTTGPNVTPKATVTDVREY